MDPETIDSEYGKLQAEVQQVGQAINTLAQKLQAVASSGDANAQEWLSDLRTIAMEVQDEQTQVQNLLQAMHGFTVSSLQQHAGALQGAMGQQGFGQPGFDQQGFGQPGYDQQGFGQPGFGQQGFGQPGFGQPGMVQEEMMMQEGMQPGMGMGGMGMGGMGMGGGGGIIGRLENEHREREMMQGGMMGGGMMGGMDPMMGGPQATLDRFMGGAFSQGMAAPREGFVERHILRDLL
jgi:uncharacterized protein YhaN